MRCPLFINNNNLKFILNADILGKYRLQVFTGLRKIPDLYRFYLQKTIYSFDGIEKQSKSSSSSVTSVKSAKSFTFGFQGFNVGNYTGVK